MKLTQKLLSLLHRVFDPDPERFLALRICYGGGMTWTVSEATLTTTVTGGIGQGFSVDLTTMTLSQLVDYISARPGYSVLYADGSGNLSLGARVLIDGTGVISESNGDHLYAYTSLVWAYMESVGVELKAAKAQIPEAIKQMSVPTAQAEWIDELGAYYGVTRLQGESDQSYGARIIAETVRPRCNNVAIEQAISYYTGQTTKVTDVTIYGDAFPKYNGAVTRNGVYRYQPLSVPKFGLFDVQLGYDLLGGTDQTAFAAIVTSIVERLRSAGTHMRSLSLQSSSLSDAFAAPVDGAMTLAANMIMTDSLTVPTEPSFAVNGALAVMTDTASPGSESEFNAIRLGFCYNGVRTRNGAITYAGNTLETTPAAAKEWNFMTGILPPDVAFTRNSVATYFDSTGLMRIADVNEARFAYNPTTNALRGLLFEETRTNLAFDSNDLAGAAWTAANATATATTVLAPDGTPAVHLIENTAGGVHQVSQSGNFLTGSTRYCRSVYGKADGSGRMLYIESDNFGQWLNPGSARFNLDNGTVDQVSAGVDGYGIEACANGWYRCWIINTTVESPAAVPFDVQLATGTGPNYTGDGTSGVYVWGAQLEAGDYPTSLIPTQATAVTRAVETAEVADISWYNTSGGTLLLDCAERQVSKATTFNMSIGTDAPNYIGLGYTTTTAAGTRAYMRTANQGPLLGYASHQGSLRSVVTWDSNDFSQSNNGAQVTTAAAPTGGIPPVVSMRMGYSHYNTTPAPMVLQRLAYWGVRFPDHLLPTLSTPMA